MDLDQSGASEARFAKYVAGLGSVIGHAERMRPLRDYCTGLVLPGERKSVEPMAARTAPARTAAQHQSLLHFVANAAWSDEDVLAKVREMVLPAIEKSGPVEAWIIDDTSFPKQGKHSVGVHHQYCGQLGKQANCQVAVSLSVANHAASLPVAYQLYLPEAWTKDRARRKKAGVPKQIKFKTKPQIALEPSAPPSAQRSCVRQAASGPCNSRAAVSSAPRDRSHFQDRLHTSQTAFRYLHPDRDSSGPPRAKY